MDLFSDHRKANRRKAEPLASRMRPRSLDDFVGQEHFLGPGKLLRRMLQADRLGSLIFTGPPGTGKTALAHVIAHTTKRRFAMLNATSAGAKEVRAELEAADRELETTGRGTILFLDELHRFNKAQQDLLLPGVEAGTVTLIGATTQNPFFSIVAPLLSRGTIFTFEPHTREHVVTILKRAQADRERGLGAFDVQATDDALALLAEMSDGDARRALTALEVGVLSSGPPVLFDRAAAAESIQRKVQVFDPTGDDHYDLASAFIKSLRGSDADAAVYWLARMLESGEEPRFIARRLIIFASEDVGNADPHALPLAAACVQAVEFVGLPECQLPLSQTVAYLALAPKSNAATVAIGEARKDVREGRTLPVPKHLRDSHYGGAKELGHGTGYQYAHDFAGGWVDQEYLPEVRHYYEPTDRGFEATLRQRIDELRRRFGRGTQPADPG